MKVVELTEEEYKDKVKEGRVLVDFYADWCGPCKMLSPLVDQVAEETNTCKFYKVNIDNAPNISEELEIMAVPTLLVYNNGEIVDKAVGLISKDEILNLIH